MSLKCREIRTKLSDKLDDRLEWGSLASVQAHLRQCDDCRQYARECELLIDWLRDVPAVPAPNILPGVLAGLASRREPPRPILSWRRGLLGVVAAASLVALSWAIGVSIEDARHAEAADAGGEIVLNEPESPKRSEAAPSPPPVSAPRRENRSSPEASQVGGPSGESATVVAEVETVDDDEEEATLGESPTTNVR